MTIFLLLVVVHFQDDQEFSPTASLLCRFISGTTHLNFILQNSWHTVPRSGRKWLGISIWPQPLFMIPTNSWSMILFSLQDPGRSEKTLAHVALLQDTVSYPYGPLFTMTLLKILDITYHQNFALPWHLCLLIWQILSFLLYRFDRVDRVDRVSLLLSDPFLLLWIHPCKILSLLVYWKFKLTC